MQYGTAICPLCSKNYTKNAENQKFCSRECYNKVHRPERSKEKKFCGECAEEFLGNKKEKYCSDKCRKAIKNRANNAYFKKERTRMKCRMCGRMFWGRMLSPLCSKRCREIFRSEQL